MLKYCRTRIGRIVGLYLPYGVRGRPLPGFRSIPERKSLRPSVRVESHGSRRRQQKPALQKTPSGRLGNTKNVCLKEEVKDEHEGRGSEPEVD